MQHLIEKYLNGTATEDERRQLMEWYSQQADQPAVWESTEEMSVLKERMLNNVYSGIRKKKHNYLKYAAVFVLLLLSFFITKHLLKAPEKMTVVSTFTGETKVFSLPDGSKIWLMPNSRVSYRHARDLDLKGEAFFEVVKDEAHPFVVHVRGLTTKVLGTSFNIKAYDEDTVAQVTLLTGLVELYGNNTKLRLKPMQQGIFNKQHNNIICTDYPDANEMLLRREGQLEFKNVRVAEVIKELERKFKVEIVVDAKTMNCLFFGRLKANEDVDKFLEKLSIILNATLEKKGNQYYLLKGHC